MADASLSCGDEHRDLAVLVVVFLHRGVALAISEHVLHEICLVDAHALPRNAIQHRLEGDSFGVGRRVHVDAGLFVTDILDRESDASLFMASSADCFGPVSNQHPERCS
jgi:hypothetical protein